MLWQAAPTSSQLIFSFVLLDLDLFSNFILLLMRDNLYTRVQWKHHFFLYDKIEEKWTL